MAQKPHERASAIIGRGKIRLLFSRFLWSALLGGVLVAMERGMLPWITDVPPRYDLRGTMIFVFAVIVPVLTSVWTFAQWRSLKKAIQLPRSRETAFERDAFNHAWKRWWTRDAGMLTWGIFVGTYLALGFSFISPVFAEPSNGFEWYIVDSLLNALFAYPISLAGGYAWGLSMWRWFERRSPSS